MNNVRVSFVLGVSFAVALTAALVFAQGSYKEHKQQIELTRWAVQSERKAAVTDNLQLTEQESKVFWPLYDEYRAAMGKVGERTTKLITDYADAYTNNNLSDDQALQMVSDYLSIETDKLKVKKRYVKRFEAVLPPKKLARFFQIDNKMDAYVNAAIAKNVPLVE
jgi:hypothetical protein